MDDRELQDLADAITALPTAEWPGGYEETGLALLDAVYSVNANYETTTRKVIERYCIARDERARTDTASEIQAVIEHAGGPEKFAEEVVANRQLTSTTNGILKAAAVLEVAEVLGAHRANSKADLEALSNEALKDLESAWRRVRGQSSGITWRYFLMLLNLEGVKPDRMIMRFIEATIGRSVSVDEAAELITAAAQRAELGVTEADHRIWSSISRGEATED